jgi:hypothetical protein
MKLEFVKQKESYKNKKERECCERAQENKHLRDFGPDEEENATPPSRFLMPLILVINFILAIYWRFRNNLYDAMDESVEIYNISSYDMKRLNFKGVDMTHFNGMIILAELPVMQRKYIAVFKWKGSKADKTKQAKDALALAAVSTYVSVPSGTITALGLLATAYGDSTPAGEQAAWTALNNGMEGLKFLFQSYANANPTTAQLGIESGGFSCKKVTPRKQQPWAVKNNPVGGILDLTAAGAKGGFHDWWISYNGITFVRLDPTMKAHTQVTGLASGIEVYFMHQVITSNGPQGFDAVLKITVN